MCLCFLLWRQPKKAPKGCEAQAEHHRSPSGDDWETDNVKGVNTNFRASPDVVSCWGQAHPVKRSQRELTHLVLVRAFSESEGHTSLAKYAPKRGWVNSVSMTGREYESTLQLGAIAESERQQKIMIKGVQPLKVQGILTSRKDEQSELVRSLFLGAAKRSVCARWCINSTIKAYTKARIELTKRVSTSD